MKILNTFSSVVTTILSDEFPSVKNHIIIITKSLENVCDLVRPLRAKYLGVLCPIVILCPLEMNSMIWGKLVKYDAGLNDAVYLSH
jgi:hypothetical protein